MPLETPEFHPGYAALILVFLAACASLFKPKDNYRPLQLKQFDAEKIIWKKRSIFCLARVQYWTIRFIFYYAIPHVAIGLYILTIALSIAISISRINNDFHQHIIFIQDENQQNLCHDIDKQLTDDLNKISITTQRWSDQLTWLLIAYFFQVWYVLCCFYTSSQYHIYIYNQKMFGATLLINGGGSAMIGAVVFDPWLLISTFWGTNIENQLLKLINSNSMELCLNKWDNNHMIFDSIKQVIFTVNQINICLWTMCAMSLSAGLLIDIICTFIREFEYCFKSELNQDKSLWNRITCCITRAVEAADDVFDDALEDLGVKEESSEDENQQNHINDNVANNNGKTDVKLEIKEKEQ